MNNGVKTGSYDLQAVVVLSTVFFLVILFLPNLILLRIIFGLPFLLFYPGYAFVSLLYPTSPQKPDETEQKDEKKEDIPKKGPDAGKSRRMDFSPRKRTVGKREEKEKTRDRAEEKRKPTTITLPKRIALAFALSLAISPLLGVILNDLYKYNDTIFRLDTIQETVILYIFIVGISILAVIRRERFPKAERFQVDIKMKNPLGDTRQDQVITLVLVLLIAASSVTGLYLYSNYHENDRFTEFYIFDRNNEIGVYPRIFYIDTQQTIFVGIRNNEFRTMNYSLQVGLLGSIPLSLNNITSNINLTEDTQYIKELRLGHDDEFTSILNFTIPIPGSHEVLMFLVVDGMIYRSLNLHVQVFDRRDLKYARNGTVMAYLTGPDGLVSTIEDLVSSQENYSFMMNIRNFRDHSIATNTTVRITDYPPFWTDHYRNGNTSYVNYNNGIYIQRRIDTDSRIQNSFNFRLPRGVWKLIINVQGSGWMVYFNRTVEIY
ncbi:MAG: DUF1616 domain-containing protein [Thermoplasmatota archaeon]